MGGRMTIAAERDQIAFHHPRRSGYEILCDGLRGLSWNRTTDSASHLAVVPAPPDNIFPYQRRTLEDPGFWLGETVVHGKHVSEQSETMAAPTPTAPGTVLGTVNTCRPSRCVGSHWTHAPTCSASARFSRNDFRQARVQRQIDCRNNERSF